MQKVAHSIPSESFFVANERIMAAICGGQLTTDHVLGVSAFHAPAKDSPTLVQSTRLLLSVDGTFVEAIDLEQGGAIVDRSFVDGSMTVKVTWRGAGVEVEDVYFIPPGFDAVIQRSRIRNTLTRPVRLKIYGILYPQLGSPVPHKKGICQQGHYDADHGCVVIEDTKQNVLAFAFDTMPSEFQLGEVCGSTDVYYDLEDDALSGNTSVKRVTPNAALALDAGSLSPNQERMIEVCLGHASDVASALRLVEQFRRESSTLWRAHEAYGRSVLQLAEPALPSVGHEFGPQLDEVTRRSVLVLRSILRPDGAPMGGIHCYQNVGQVRNGSYILSVLDQLGFHQETRGGYDFYLNFRVGDDRYSSPDENDQLGTVLYVLRRRLDLTGDFALIEQHRSKVLAIADRLIGLIDARLGLIYSERAIHEFVSISRGYETYVNTMAWRGLADAAVLAEHLGEKAAAGRYSEAAAGLRERVVKHLVDPDKGVFVKRLYRGKHYALPAISMITPALFGLIDANDAIVTRTIAYMTEANWDKTIGGVYRYPLSMQPWPEHPFGGPWVTYTSWLGGVFLMRGERDQTARCIQWVLDQLPLDSNLIAEHFSVQHIGRRGYGRIYLDPATPEVWATAEYLRLVLAYTNGNPRADHI
jgi:hypothetical protein